MKIRITDAPLGHSFTDDKPYHVYGFSLGPQQAYVFDDDCESCFLTDLEWETWKNED